MKKRNLIAVAAVAILLAACIPSINPFYTDKDVVFDQHLIGEWQEKGETNAPEVWKFEQATNNAYKLTISKQGKTGEFSAHLFKLQQEQFLDMIPTDCKFAPEQAEWVQFAMFPGHLLLRIGQIEPGLKLAITDPNWIEKYLEKNPNAIAYHAESGRMIFTADTAELQKFVLSHLGTNELFGDFGEFTRVK